MNEKTICSALFHHRQFLMLARLNIVKWRRAERELQFSEYFCSKLFVKYHEFNIVGQVSDLWCMPKYSAYVQFFIFSLTKRVRTSECECWSLLNSLFSHSLSFYNIVIIKKHTALKWKKYEFKFHSNVSHVKFIWTRKMIKDSKHFHCCRTYSETRWKSHDRNGNQISHIST